MNKKWFLSAVLVLLLPSARATEARESDKPSSFNSITGPQLGIVFDRSDGGLRPIWGIPGASTVGGLLELEMAIAQAWVSPQRDYALVKVEGDERILVAHLKRAPVSVEPIVGPTGIDRIALSPAGRSALMYSGATRTVHFITGLPQEPAMIGEVDLSSLPGSVGALAISEDGRVILLGISEEERGSVHVITAGGQPRILSALSEASAISFLNDTHDAFVTDRQGNRVLLVRDVIGAAEIVTLAGEDQGILGPIAVQISDDNRRIFVANSGSSTVTVLDLESGNLTQLPCDRVPSGLYRLGEKSVFRLTEFSRDPLLLLDGGAEEPRILFVPPPSP